jgi:tubulin beta
LVFDKQGIGGDSEYFGYNDAQLDSTNAFYHEASGGKYVPHVVLFELEPGVIGAVRASPLGGVFRPGNLVNQNSGAVTTGPRATTKGLGTNSDESPYDVRLL